MICVIWGLQKHPLGGLFADCLSSWHWAEGDCLARCERLWWTVRLHVRILQVNMWH